MKKVKVLITGGAGFIGSHLTDRLIEDGFEVFIVDNLSKGREENLNKRAKFFKLDIESLQFLDLVEKINPNVIYHLAAQSSISQSFKNPRNDFQINLLATLKLLEKARELKVKKIIFASSAAVFGKAKKLPIDENHSRVPVSYYGISKLCSEYLFKNYFLQHKLPYVILRFANVYGPRQDASGEGGVVAIFSGEIIKGKPLTVYGNGNQTRDFIYVTDVVEALAKCLEDGVLGTFNIGTSIQTSINQLATKLVSIYAAAQPIEIIHAPRRFLEVEKSSLSFEKFQKKTGFEPKVSLSAGLKKTLNYFKQIIT